MTFCTLIYTYWWWKDRFFKLFWYKFSIFSPENFTIISNFHKLKNSLKFSTCGWHVILSLKNKRNFFCSNLVPKWSTQIAGFRSFINIVEVSLRSLRCSKSYGQDSNIFRMSIYQFLAPDAQLFFSETNTSVLGVHLKVSPTGFLDFHKTSPSASQESCLRVPKLQLVDAMVHRMITLLLGE